MRPDQIRLIQSVFASQRGWQWLLFLPPATRWRALLSVVVAVHQGNIEQIQTEDHIDQCFHGYASRRVI